eukprot:scaffold710_cov171-Amphora_coffeaeformis.AAC.41
METSQNVIVARHRATDFVATEKEKPERRAKIAKQTRGLGFTLLTKTVLERFKQSVCGEFTHRFVVDRS